MVIDLKTGKLTHQDIGQMDMYVRMFDDLKRGEDDNPTIGIILCSDKEDTVVRYSILKDSEQLFYFTISAGSSYGGRVESGTGTRNSTD